MCTADVGIFGYYWWKGQDIPLQDFETVHRCRNFNDILDWGIEHQMEGLPWDFSNEPQPGDVVKDPAKGDTF